MDTKRTTSLLTWSLLLLLVPGLAAAQDTGVVRGTVTDASTGETLPGANVAIEGQQGGAATDAQGRYRLEVAPGTYVLQASFVGYEQVERSVTVETGETVTRNF